VPEIRWKRIRNFNSTFWSAVIRKYAGSGWGASVILAEETTEIEFITEPKFVGDFLALEICVDHQLEASWLSRRLR